MTNETKIGCKVGERCNRAGCDGTIAAYEVNCSCHIVAPCGECETKRPPEYCPNCGWEAKNDD